MPRVLQAELLDALPPECPAARRSRRELLRVNRVMGNPAWFARVVPALVLPGERVLELGAGDGVLTRSLRSAGVAADALDRFPAPPAWRDPGCSPAADAARWHVADIRDFIRWADYPVVLGNLILHHLDDTELAALGAALNRHARALVFSEPLRRPRSRLLWALGAPLGGAGPVTRHDGRVSIGAGFRDDELPRALGLDPARWDCRVSETFFGASRLIALRRP